MKKKNKVVKIYISGKITGEKDYRFKFWKASWDIQFARDKCSDYKLFMESGCEGCLFLRGHYCQNPFGKTIHIVNPATFEWLTGKPWWLCMVVCLWRLLRCEYVYMLDNWEDSRGARWEHWLAVKTKKVILYQYKKI